MKKLILFVAGFMAIATAASAQGIVNSGVRMVCKSGTYWVVDGNFTLKSESAPSQATAANIKINTGANLTLTGASVLSVSGWWQNDGAFTAATGSTVTLNGTFKQELGGASETTFSNLTLNNTAGATFFKNITTNGILNFQNGIIYTGELSAIIGASGSITNASATKFINGRLVQTFSAVGSKIFPIGMAG